MTLDEIIAGMEHEQRWTQLGAKVCSNGCPKCQLIAFRAEFEEMTQRWDSVYWMRQCAAELRTKIGEKR